MKYRSLKPEELESLEEDFIQFLAANTITGEDWKNIQSNEPEKRDEIIGMFSEIVWEKVLGNITYMRHRFPRELRVYKFDENDATAIVLRLGTDGLDFTDSGDVKSLAEGKIDLTGFNPEVLHGTRAYRTSRKEEIFELMEQGARPCKEVFWRSVSKMIPA